MKLRPLFTEKSTREAKAGKYTFSVPVVWTKETIKKAVETIFGVEVTEVWTMRRGGGRVRDARGRMKRVRAVKKAVVALKEGQKIELFEEEKKKAKKIKKAKKE